MSRYERLYRDVDFREQPHLYRVSKGEEGVLLVQPYKDEILPSWQNRTPEQALASAEKIYSLYLDYQQKQDFVGMDMARKFLQMGYTRSKHYINHRSRGKHDTVVYSEAVSASKVLGRREILTGADHQKAASAAFFLAFYVRVVEDPNYQRMKIMHQKAIKERHHENP